MSIGNIKPVYKNVKLDKLVENPNNPRFHKGQSILGINVRDTTNTDTMCMVIRENNGVPNRLVVEELENGTFNVLCGNRRLIASRKLVADPTTPQELVKTLETLPCDVYKDLTDKQRNDLVNDQRSQKFMRSEIVAYIFRLQKAGWSFPEIAMHVYTQMGVYASSGARKLAEIEACKDDTERKQIITRWLKGTLDTIILNCGKLGQRVQKALLLTEMQNDGISPVIGVDDNGKDILDKPEFKPTQGRCLELVRAKNADESWTSTAGGIEFNNLIEKYKQEDNGEKNPAEKVARLSDTQLTDQVSLTQSKAAKAALEVARGLKPIYFADVDNEAARLESLVNVTLKHRNDIKNDVIKQFAEILLTGDALQLEGFLVKNS